MGGGDQGGEQQQRGGGVALEQSAGRGGGTTGEGGLFTPTPLSKGPHYSDKHLLTTLKTGTVSFIHIRIVKYLNRHFILPPLASGPGVTKCRGEESRGLAFRFRI